MDGVDLLLAGVDLVWTRDADADAVADPDAVTFGGEGGLKKLNMRAKTVRRDVMSRTISPARSDTKFPVKTGSPAF
jgi:hypothetical protein